MKKGKELDYELWVQCKERATMEFPRKEVDGTITEDYDEHQQWYDGYYGR